MYPWGELDVNSVKLTDAQIYTLPPHTPKEQATPTHPTIPSSRSASIHSQLLDWFLGLAALLHLLKQKTTPPRRSHTIATVLLLHPYPTVHHTTHLSILLVI